MAAFRAATRRRARASRASARRSPSATTARRTSTWNARKSRLELSGHRRGPPASRRARPSLGYLAGVRLGVGAASSAEVAPRLALRAVDPAEDHEVPRVQARILGRVDHAHVAQPRVERLSRLAR